MILRNKRFKAYFLSLLTGLIILLPCKQAYAGKLEDIFFKVGVPVATSAVTSAITYAITKKIDSSISEAVQATRINIEPAIPQVRVDVQPTPVVNILRNSSQEDSILLDIMKGFIPILAIYFQLKATNSSNCVSEEKSKLKLADLAGTLSPEIEKVVDLFRNPFYYNHFTGNNLTQNLIFYGQPGTGKTMAARAIAGELDAYFFNLDPASILTPYYGQSPKNIKRVFEKARRLANKDNTILNRVKKYFKSPDNPIKVGFFQDAEDKNKINVKLLKNVENNNKVKVVMFFDEFEGLGASRGGHNHSEDTKIVDALLSELTNPANKNILVIVATNSLEAIDPALIRSGRLGTHVEFKLPNFGNRLALFRMGVEKTICNKEKYKLNEDDYKKLAEMTNGFSHADIAKVIQDAIMNAGKERKSIITIADIRNAIEDLKKPSRNAIPESAQLMFV